MAVHLPGTIGLMLRSPTPQFRYDVGIAGGHIMFGCWIYPEDINSDQEIIVIADAYSGIPAGVVFSVLRLEGSIVGPGTITVILQGTLFGFCTVRRSVTNTLVANQWQRIDVVCASGITDCHLYVNGVEPTYAFTRSEAGLPPNGGRDVLFGSTYRGDGVTAPHYACGSRTINGDTTNGDLTKRFTTAAGGFFKGGMSHPGFWHAGAPALNAGMIQALADGFSPSFLSHYMESSSVSVALMMCPGLYGDGDPSGSAYNPELEFDPKSGIKLEYTLGSGHCVWMDGPGVSEPVGPEIEGPGPTIPKTPRLCLPFWLPRAEIYNHPGNPADLLPIVYGDFRLGGFRGPVPATLIDTGADGLAQGPWVFCAAYHPVMSLDSVYIDDILQAPGSYTASISDNYEGKGTIASITFTTQPTGQVSWRGRGTFDSTGTALMENCIDQVVHLLTTWGNFDLAEDFDLTNLYESKAKIDTLGYLTAFVILNTQVTQDWITEMLFNVMGYWRVNGRQQLEFHIDDGYATLTLSDVNASIIAARDCIDGDDGVEFIIDKQNLVNDITAYYLYSYSLGEPSSRLVTLKDQTSIDAYTEISKAVTLKGLRRQADVRTWANILLARQSGRTRVEGALVHFTLKGGRYGHLSIGDLIAFSWPYGPTRELDHPYVNEILRIANLSLDLSRGGALEILAVDLGIYFTSAGVRNLTPVEV